MCDVGDPVASDVVSNLARPDSNITGLSSLVVELSAKRLELLKEMAPALSRVAILTNPTIRAHRLALESLRRGADMLHVSLALLRIP
jgi:putative ABC transport system substrate-binding protein